MKEVLLIFLKNPQVGKVKIRLAATIGNEQTLFIYQKLIEHTIAVTKELSIDKIVFYSDFINKKDNWNNSVFQKELQSGNNLGERMKSAFKGSFTGGYRKVVIIGTDCFDLTETIIDKAFESLNEYDLVIGAAEDGGYYLLGMKKFLPEIFESIEWSTDKVFDQTMAVCNNLDLSVFLLPKLNDIDDEEDLKKQEGLFFLKNKEI